MKTYYLVITLTIIVFEVFSCHGQNKGISGGYEMVLEYKDVQGFSLKTNELADSTELDISGLAFHSALAVKEIRTEIHGTQMIAKIILVPARKGLSGRFAFKINVPNSVQEVLFGDSLSKIWHR